MTSSDTSTGANVLLGWLNELFGSQLVFGFFVAMSKSFKNKSCPSAISRLRIYGLRGVREPAAQTISGCSRVAIAAV